MHTAARYNTKAGKVDQAAGRIFSATADNNRYSFPDLSKFSAQAQVFTSDPWVHIGTDLVAKNCALVNLGFYQSNAAKHKAIPNPPFNVLLRKPNNHMSQYEF